MSNSKKNKDENSPEKKEKSSKETSKKEPSKKDDTSKKKETTTENGKKDNKKVLLLVGLGLIALLFFCCITGFVALAYFGDTEDVSDLADIDPIQETLDFEDDNYDHTTYLGYADIVVVIEDNEEFTQRVFEFYDGFEELEKAESEMIEAAQMEDPDMYFVAYAEYNRIASELMDYAWLFDSYLNGEDAEDDAFGSMFIQKAYAKERSSWWYYVPIIGSLMKAKHQSIETSRAGIYNYMKNELPSTDKQTFLDEYGLQSVENLRDASDSQIENLARDPELRSAIDWTKVSTDAGKQAVIATVDSYKLASSRNPAKSIATASAFRVVTEKGGNVSDQMIDEEQRTTVVISNKMVNTIDEKAGDNVREKWGDISVEDKTAMTDAFITELGDLGEILAVTQGYEKDGGPKVNVPEGTYDLLTATTYTVPVQLSDVETVKGEVTDILTINPTFEVYAVDPEVAITLGFDAYQSQSELVITSCADVGSTLTTSAANSCESAYDSCMAAPLQYEDEYYSCIGSDGGCWDIGRWEYVNSDNCSIDADNNLDYSDGYFDEDFEYFPNGNLAYCECIVDCRAEYSSRTDCAGELESCCTTN